jgi:hypothetical protein
VGVGHVRFGNGIERRVMTEMGAKLTNTGRQRAVSLL